MFACKYLADDRLLAACDREVLGKKLKFGEIEIELKKSFYFEKFIEKEQLLKLLKEAKIINLFGNKIIEIAIDQNLVNLESIKIIDEVLHVQIYKV